MHLKKVRSNRLNEINRILADPSLMQLDYGSLKLLGRSLQHGWLFVWTHRVRLQGFKVTISK